MSSNNKALLVMVALLALIIGAALNSARVSDQIDTRALLSARLLNGDASDSVENNLGQLTIVNFWASWCAPCRKEMPMFESLYRANKARGFEIIGVAIDSPERAQPMLDSMDITYPILYAEQTGMKVMESAGNPDGFLPYSLLLDANGDVLDQVLGEIHQEQIQTWLAEHL